ncbi:MAG TPA: alkaline phosphatase family protein [Candidatus Limnocylindria bacterium]|jgi:predicted AlkP superfamily pyrophosphatase or phosphodiesterase|nr:alkaline phosphatase family protein [Candidatus Limnocylindria bacterium]
MKRTAVLNVVGLTKRLIGEHTPALKAFADRNRVRTIDPALPALTCTAQSNYLTGKTPSTHGIVANGWYNRELAEVQFWKQSNRLVGAPKVWGELRYRFPSFTCAKMFWWYNMYSTADYSITPRPMYPADGRKFFDVYSGPMDLKEAVKRDLGPFPFATFWGPAAGVPSPQGSCEAASKWIAESAKWVERHHQPTLNLVYLPHLDYNLQRLGPAHPEIEKDLGRIDAIVGDLIQYFESRDIQVLVVSEYGITPVNRAIHLNREFRRQGWLTIKEELGLELLDAGASAAFAVADHQVAHIYINRLELLGKVRRVVESIPGVAAVYGPDERARMGLDHGRAGDLVAFSAEDAWFTYYYWDDDAKAPDFARTVDIHRKPGYDPVELFLDPALKAAKLKIAWRLLQKKLGFRMLMDVIPLDANLVKGSHGCRPASEDEWPVLIAPERAVGEPLKSTDIYHVILRAVSDMQV